MNEHELLPDPPSDPYQAEVEQSPYAFRILLAHVLLLVGAWSGFVAWQLSTYQHWVAWTVALVIVDAEDLPRLSNR